MYPIAEYNVTYDCGTMTPPLIQGHTNPESLAPYGAFESYPKCCA